MDMNPELHNAWEFVEQTGMSVFLTGKAGTGKTTFLHDVRARSAKRMMVVAPTGVAAINAGGVTIHSFFQLPLAPFVPEVQIKTRFAFSKEKRKIIRMLDLLIIDEISMVRSDTLDAVDSVLRRFREHDKPFGGVQLVMIGDLQQLTPVVTPAEEPLLRKHYDTPYFFSSHVLQSIDYVTIELTTVYRQHDDAFIGILNRIRNGSVAEEDLARLNRQHQPDFQPETGSDYIRLTTHNRMADNYNKEQLNTLRGRSCIYTAEIDGQFPDHNYPADHRLTLKVGVQVMFIHNDSGGRYYNGKIGHVTYVGDRHIRVRCPGEREEISVEQNTWENMQYTFNEKTHQIEAKVQGTFRQYPLRLAWAITIHKSQGLTFEHAIIDAQSAFASGQVYVALSRCRSLEGLVLATPITSGAVITDGRVRNYMDGQAERTRESIDSLSTLKDAYYRNLLADLFCFREIQQQEMNLSHTLEEQFYKETGLIELHKTIRADFDKNIVKITRMWMSQITSIPTDSLHSEEFIARIRKAAQYFLDILAKQSDILTGSPQRIKSGNKQGMKFYNNALSDLKQAYHSKCNLLKRMAETNFTVVAYLQAKKDAILSAMGEECIPNQHPAHRIPLKQHTGEITYRLFMQGKSLTDIASERGLNVSTIQNHLKKYVRKGKLNVESVIGEQKANTIRRVIECVGRADGMKSIKAFCPEEITYDDISFVLVSLPKLPPSDNQEK